MGPVLRRHRGKKVCGCPERQRKAERCMGINSCYVSLPYTLQDNRHPCPALYQNASASGTCENYRRSLKFPKLPLGGSRAPIENNCPLFNLTPLRFYTPEVISISCRVVFVIRRYCQAVPFHGFLPLHTGLRSRKLAVHSSKPISQECSQVAWLSPWDSQAKILSGLPFPLSRGSFPSSNLHWQADS